MRSSREQTPPLRENRAAGAESPAAGWDQGLSPAYGRSGLWPHKQPVLLHACCGPCATTCVERLAPDYAVTVFYYNPNITDAEEYERRRQNLLRFLEAFNREHEGEYVVSYLEGDYNTEAYLRRALPLAHEPERGRRCELCYELRMAETARQAARLEMPYFTTTLSVSPHKPYETIARIGHALEGGGTAFLDIDFKKKNGFGRSVELSKRYGLYRQNFCGCEFARR